MPNRLIDITGQKFGLLTAIKKVDTKGNWLCRCDCGAYQIVASASLRNGRSKRCKECCKKNLRQDITGRRYGRLVALYLTRCNGKAYWMCQCDCGNKKEVLLSSLNYGSTRSCGCLAREVSSKTALAHRTHKESRTRLYRIWSAMKRRIDNPNCERYKNYGGRGITICEEWRNDFTAFRDWALANGYDPNAPYGVTTIDRIDVNGNYCPENCRWVDLKTQAQNRQRKKGESLNGRKEVQL